MKKKDYLRLKGLFSIALALFCIGLGFAVKATSIIGLCAVAGIGVYSVFEAYRCFERIPKTREEEQYYAPPTDATAKQKVKYYKRVILLGAIAFPALTAITVMNLSSIESGEAENLIAPVSILYRHAGYWPAVLFVPALWIVCTLVLWHKIKKLGMQEEK
ncbi:MAG TPA: hypothetical protein VNZ86_16910 [Bacteroidia bacterium]|jgi:hypothetical protein|nr:hypothetical protein [Bacteroidia bacterium]